MIGRLLGSLLGRGPTLLGPGVQVSAAGTPSAPGFSGGAPVPTRRRPFSGEDESRRRRRRRDEDALILFLTELA